jgi:hypothetical protein
MPIRKLNNRCRDECLLQRVECLKALFREDERGTFGQKMSEGPSNLEEVLNESLIEACMSQETTNSLHIGGWWQLLNDFNLHPIHLNPLL